MLYTVIYKTRQQGAIGLAENTSILVNAESPDAALDKARERIEQGGREPCGPVSVTPLFNNRKEG